MTRLLLPRRIPVSLLAVTFGLTLLSPYACALAPGASPTPSPLPSPTAGASDAANDPGDSPTPGPPTATPIASGSIPMCDDVPYLSAPADQYVGAPASVDDEENAQLLQSWAVTKPGYEGIWLDRAEHNGWITLAFSKDAQDRYAELRTEFPDVAAVVVQVDWTNSELEKLQQRVVSVFNTRHLDFASGIFITKGVVSIDLAYLFPDLVDLAQQRFSGERVCLSGGDPADAPAEGPQPTAGDGWRLLADQDGVGETYRTGIAYDAGSYAKLWRSVGLNGDQPPVDFQRSVVLWFGAVHGSSCPRLRLDDVVVDVGRSLVHPEITELDAGVCTADALPHAYVVALDRSELPGGPFAIQLAAEDPPPGVPDERTIVDADLSQPGSVASPDQISSGGSWPP